MKLLIQLLALLCLFSACKNEKHTTTEPAIEKTKSATTHTGQAATEKTAPDSAIQTDQDLQQYGIAPNKNNVLGGLKVGDIAPNFTMKDNRGRTVVLEEITAHTQVLLTFYRGDWCPYCTKQLAEFQEQVKAFDKLDHTRVVAVTPQKMLHARQMANDMGIVYSVIPDDQHKMMKDYKVFFHVTDDYDNRVKKSKGASLAEMNGDKFAVLPVPATYLIGKNMRIKYVFYDVDYRKRPDLAELLTAME